MGKKIIVAFPIRCVLTLIECKLFVDDANPYERIADIATKLFEHLFLDIELTPDETLTMASLIEDFDELGILDELIDEIGTYFNTVASLHIKKDKILVMGTRYETSYIRHYRHN